MSRGINLSKSRYIAGLQCPKRLWLETNRPDLVEYDESQQAIFEQGTDVGEKARLLYPNGVLIREDYLHIKEAIESTKKAVEKGARVLFEAGAEHGRVRSRADVLSRNGDGSWDLIEVKSSTGVRGYQYHDMAIQKWIFDGAGYPIRKCFLCHVDNQYVRRGDVEWNKLFKMADITRDVGEILPEVGEKVGEFMRIAGSADEPKVPLGSRCSAPYTCGLMGYCWKDMPEDNVFDLCWGKGLPDKLYERGIVNIKDIPDGEKLNKNQAVQVEVAKSGKPHWDEVSVKEFIGRIRYPIQFLDFEADNPAIPLYEETRPFQKIPFQYSLHVAEKKGMEPVHRGFLGDGVTDPRGPLAERLAGDLKPEGSVVVYYDAYEGDVLKMLAEMFPEHAEVFRSAIHRMVDLADPFTHRNIAYPQFHGSASLKVVLPVMVPGMTYEGMEVGEGNQAVAAYRKLGGPDLSSAEREKIRESLLDYCAQDTMAMVRLYEQLSKGGGI